MDRKEFLKRSALLSLLPFIPMGFHACGRGQSPRAVVFVQLSGGNDGLNTLIPLNRYTELSRARGNLLIPENRILQMSGVAELGLHPSMGAIGDLFRSGAVQFIQGVGYPEQSYSHFRSMDIYHTGAKASEALDTGWLARYMAKRTIWHQGNLHQNGVPQPVAIGLGEGATMLTRGKDEDFGTVVDPAHGATRFDTFGGMPEHQQHSAAEKLRHIQRVMDYSRKYFPAIDNALRTEVPHSQAYDMAGDNPLAEQLKAVSKMIASGLQTPAYHVELRGFDTHQEQVDSHDPTKGAHAMLLTQLSSALSGFWDDLVRMGSEADVLCVVFSEFGRRIVSNGSHGTDHGSSQPIMLVGKNVRSGVLGESPLISAQASVEDNLGVQYDFRAVFASVMQQWFGFSQEETASVFNENLPQVPIIR